MAFRRGIISAEKVTPHPFGLFSAAKVITHGGRDDHWVAGAAVETESCVFDAKLIDICGGISPVTVFDGADQDRYFDVMPFGILATDSCPTIGWSVEDRKARVIRQLELVTQKAVETELWNGTYNQALTAPDPGTGRYLSSDAATKVNGDTAVKPLLGLALLEQALATCGVGSVGTVHTTPLVASMLGNQQLEVDDRALQTVNGNKVVSGSGYDGRGPGEDADDVDPFIHWMYAVGPVFVHLGTKELITVTEGQATDAVTNEMTYVAERPALAYWDGCCHFAVKVDVRL